jgi:uncharacterized protein YlxW (UPF0749 family)
VKVEPEVSCEIMQLRHQNFELQQKYRELQQQYVQLQTRYQDTKKHFVK